MAVSKTQNWSTPASADPAGTVTIGGGTNRVLIFSQSIEFIGDVTASIEIGGVPATGVKKFFYDVTGDDLISWMWYWNESDLQSMSGNGIDYTDSEVIVKRRWSYATYSSADQTIPVVFSSAGSETVTASNPLVVPTPGASGDYVAVATAGKDGSRDIEWGSLTEQFDEQDSEGGGARFGLADGVWAAATETTSQHTSNRTQIALAVTVKQAGATGGGSGNIIAPSAIVSGSADRYDGLIAASPQVDGVGERTIVWQGGVELTAPKAKSSIDATFTLIFNDPSPTQLEPEFANLLGIGTRGSNGTGSCTAALPILTSYSPNDILGTGSCDAPLPTVSGTDEFDAFWYTSKTVYFLGA